MFYSESLNNKYINNKRFFFIKKWKKKVIIF